MIEDEDMEYLQKYTLGSYLSIQSVDVEDFTNFTCKAVNSEGKAELTIEVLNIVQISGEGYYREGDTVTIVCKCSRTPTPSLTWYHQELGAKEFVGNIVTEHTHLHIDKILYINHKPIY